MKHLDHIGIGVKNLEESNALYELLLGKPPYKEEIIESENIVTSFFDLGESKIELLQATDKSSAIAQFIEKKGEGIHHIAFEVDDIKAEIKRLEALDFKLIHKEPKKGADNKWIAFLHPKSTGRVLIELCQSIS